MKKLITRFSDILTPTRSNTIHITMYLRPEIYLDSEIVTGSSHYRKVKKKYRNSEPYRRINGPLSDYGQELEPPIREEYENFIQDCIDAVEDEGFTIIQHYRSEDSNKSEYVLLYGMKDNPCGYLVYDLRISDHPLDATFPEELKDVALEYLKMNNVLDGSASKAGINFRVEKVTVGSVKDDNWGRALERLYAKLDTMRRKIQRTLNVRK